MTPLPMNSSSTLTAPASILKTSTKLIQYDRFPHLLTVKYGLHVIGSQAPYFTVTGEIWEATAKGRRKGRDCVCGGCIHDNIEKRFPGQFTDLIALHLSDIDGVPIHAEANGFYWLAGCIPGNLGERYHGGDGANGKTAAQVLAEHLRVDAATVDTLIAEAQLRDNVGARYFFSDYVTDCKPRWKAEADAAIAKHGLNAA